MSQQNVPNKRFAEGTEYFTTPLIIIPNIMLFNRVAITSLQKTNLYHSIVLTAP
jgi:hypothetical protein